MTTKEEREAFWAGLEVSRKEHGIRVAEALRAVDDIIKEGEEDALYNAGLTPRLSEIRTNVVYLANQLDPPQVPVQPEAAPIDLSKLAPAPKAE